MTDGKLQSSHETIIVDDVVDVNVVNVVIIVDANIKPICNFAVLSNIFLVEQDSETFLSK